MSECFINNYVSAKGTQILLIRGEWCSDVEQRLASDTWDKIILYAFDWPSYEGLIPYKEKIRWLELVYIPDTPKGLEQLVFLEKLFFEVLENKPIDFRKFPKLKELKFGWIRGMQPIFLDVDSLQWLSIHRYPKSDLNLLPKLQNLTHFEIYGGKIIDLSGIDKFPNIQSLDITQSSLKTLSGIEALTKLSSLRLCKLRELHDVKGIENIHNLNSITSESLIKVTNIDFIKNLYNLSSLHLSTPNACIENLDWVDNMPNLENLVLGAGAHEVNWDKLAKHPCLKNIAIMVSNNFSICDDQVKNTFLQYKKNIKRYSCATNTRKRQQCVIIEL